MISLYDVKNVVTSGNNKEFTDTIIDILASKTDLAGLAKSERLMSEASCEDKLAFS